jgi:alpha-L-fucosidase
MVEELVTQYGKIDVMWYDLPQGLSAAQWRAKELNAMVRQLQPGILINNRSMLAEDFSISEQNSNAPSMGRMWEACMTLNESWAYVDGDKDFKTPRQVARTLAKISSHGGNLLLNVGPDASGRLPDESRQIVDRVGAWLERNREAIEAKPVDRLPFNLWGSTLAAENRMYLFLERYFGSELRIGGLVPNVIGAKLLSYPADLTWERRGDQTIIRGLPAEDPDDILTVLRLDLDGPPDQEISRVISGADIMARFPD